MKALYYRIGLLVFLIACISIIQAMLDTNPHALDFYVKYVFLPSQTFRSSLFNRTSISIGDFLYVFLALVLVVLLVRLVYFAITFKKNKEDFWVELTRFFIFPLGIYLAFLLLWGGNYSRQRISDTWQTEGKRLDTTSLIALNEFLVERLNSIVEDTVPVFPDLNTLNAQSRDFFAENWGNQLPELKVKPTTLGYLLSYLGIHGYYNPLSGEAQFNKFILPFMHPFVITHEMAHQVGVAKEDDANLIAYIICVNSPDAAFRYSAYFNLFLYAHSELKEMDRTYAEGVLSHLNAHSRQDITDLQEMYRRYRSSLRRISNSIYDEYLRLHGQKKGLSSYNQVVRWVYHWEFSGHRETIKIM